MLQCILVCNFMAKPGLGFMVGSQADTDDDGEINLTRISRTILAYQGYPGALARKQYCIYINNSPGAFSCISAGANTGATCIRIEMKSIKNLANMRKMIPQ